MKRLLLAGTLLVISCHVLAQVGKVPIQSYRPVKPGITWGIEKFATDSILIKLDATSLPSNVYLSDVVCAVNFVGENDSIIATASFPFMEEIRNVVITKAFLHSFASAKNARGDKLTSKRRIDGQQPGDNAALSMPSTDSYELVSISPITFAAESAHLDPASRAALDDVITFDSGKPGAGLIEVWGFSDSSGPPAYNLNLSARRADEVRSYLVSKGVRTTAVNAVGWGETPMRWAGSPVAADSARRVDIQIWIPKFQF
jgi:outer membrane protein OmpA-like peptidoglycan-associated protein